MKFGEVYNILMKDLVECETEEEIEDIYQYHYKDETEREKMKEIMTLILEYQYNEKLYGKTKENDDNVIKKIKEIELKKYLSQKNQESETEEEIEEVDETERDDVSKSMKIFEHKRKKIFDEHKRNEELYGKTKENDYNFMKKSIEILKKINKE